jgi:hypothetical protein
MSHELSPTKTYLTIKKYEKKKGFYFLLSNRKAREKEPSLDKNIDFFQCFIAVFCRVTKILAYGDCFWRGL